MGTFGSRRTATGRRHSSRWTSRSVRADARYTWFANSTCQRHCEWSAACHHRSRTPVSPPGKMTSRPRSSSDGQPSSRWICLPSRTRNVIGPGAPRLSSGPAAMTVPSSPRTVTSNSAGAACTRSRLPAAAASTSVRANDSPVDPTLGIHRSQISSTPCRCPLRALPIATPLMSTTRPSNGGLVSWSGTDLPPRMPQRPRPRKSLICRRSHQQASGTQVEPRPQVALS
jgi:hypothetical protein